MPIEKTKNMAVIRTDSPEDLRQDLQIVRDDKNIRVLILSFVDEQKFADENNFDEKITEQIKNFSIPVITTIKKNAAGVLAEIVLASHLCLASDSAIFEIENFEKMRMPTGAKMAEQPDLIKSEISAKKACELGLINRVVPENDPEKEAFEMAEKIAKLAPRAIRSCLKAITKGLERDLEDGLKLETELFAAIFATDDMKEGTRAFLEKRPPKFRGK